MTFSVQYDQKLFNEVSWSNFIKLSARGYNWATLFLGDINTETWPSSLRESQMREKYDYRFCATRTIE
jgi:hypothetical protein